MGLMGCSGEVPGADGQGLGQAIGFSCYEAQAPTRAGEAQALTRGGEAQALTRCGEAQALTRAGEVQRTIPQDGCIGIYAYYHDGTDADSDGTDDTDGTWSDTATPDFMFNQRCRNTGSDYFVYAPLKYWPNEQHDKISFVAYYPYTDSSIADPSHPDSPASTGVTPLLANDGTGLPSFEFSVSSDPAAQTDFLVSDLLPALPNGSLSVAPGSPGDREELTVTDRVHFYFRHALAKVEFRIVVHPDIRPYFSRLTLNSLDLSSICDHGRLSLAYDPAEGTALAWTPLPVGSPSTHDYADIDFKQAYLMLPQAIGDDVRLTLDYDLTLKGYNSVYTYVGGKPDLQDTYTYTNTATVQLNKMKNPTTGANVGEWLPGTHYVYTIRLSANRIEYTGQVVEWGDTDAIESIPVEEK